MGNLEPENVCESQVECQETVGEPGKSAGEPICSSFVVLEIIFLQEDNVTMFGRESREGKCLCLGKGMQWACPGLEPLLHSTPRAGSLQQSWRGAA